MVVTSGEHVDADESERSFVYGWQNVTTPHPIYSYAAMVTYTIQVELPDPRALPRTCKLARVTSLRACELASVRACELAQTDALSNRPR